MAMHRDNMETGALVLVCRVAVNGTDPDDNNVHGGWRDSLYSAVHQFR